MNILLIHPPDEMEKMLGAGKAFVQKYEPLGLLYIAAVARDAGFDVEVIDAHASDMDAQTLRDEIVRRAPDILGIATLTCSGGIVYEIGRWLKQHMPEMLIVLGNVHASIYAEQYLLNGACDMVVHGEGEYPFLKICEYRSGRGELSDIPSTSYLDDQGRVRLSASPALVPELTDLPLPARDLVDQSLYRLDNVSNQLYVGKTRSTSKTMTTSRGCRYKCTFCVVNQKPRFASAMSVVDEMELLQKEYDASYVLIIDPLCMADHDRMIAICDEYKRRKLTIRWGCDARVNSIKPDLLHAMDSAGCYDLSFGIESGVQRLLNNVKKGTRIDIIERTVRMVKEESSISVGGLFILGLPGETYADSLETIRFAKSLPLDMAQFSILTPYPGSAIYTELAKSGDIDTGIRPDGTLDTSVWARYSAYISFTDGDPIWVTPDLTMDQIKKLQKRAQREFFLRPSMIMKHLKRVRPSNVLKMVRIAKEAFI